MKRFYIIVLLSTLFLKLKAQIVYGIDVSGNNGTITNANWASYKAAGVEFAFEKATEGKSYTSYALNTNVTNGSASQVRMGVYHFALPEDNPAVSEANYFLNNAGNYIGTGYLPPSLDIEDPSLSANSINKQPLSTYYSGNWLTLAQWINDWCSLVHNAKNIWPVVYVSKCYAGVLQPYYVSGIINSNIKLWIADYDHPAGSPDNSTLCTSTPWVGWPWLFHQFYDPGTQSPAIPTSNIYPTGMDRNAYNGSLADLNTLVGGTSCSQPSNDYCSAPTTLTPNANCSYTQGTTCGATPPTNGLVTACTTNSPPDDDVWYQFTATSTSHTITLQTITSTFDGVIELMSGTCPSSLNSIGCANSFGVGSTETLTKTGLTIGNTYFIRVFSNGNGIANTGDFNICVTSSSSCIPVSIIVQPTNQSSTVGGTATFSVVTSGASVAYQWYKNGIAISGETGNSYSTPTLSSSDDGNTYYCHISNCNGAYSIYSNTVFLTVSSSCTPVSLAIQPTNQSTTVGNTVTFSVSANGTGPYTYQWYKNGLAIGGQTSYSYTTPSLTLSDNGNTYYCYITNCSGSNSITSNIASLSVSNSCITPNTPIPNTGTSSCPGTALVNSNIHLGYNINSPSNYDIVVEQYPYGSPNIVYTQNCIVGNYPQIASTNIVSGKMYRYYVRATTDCNSCNSVYSQPNYFHIVPEILQGTSVSVCNGTGLTLTTPQITVPNGVIVTYQWYKGLNSNSTLISSQTSNSCYVTQSGYYYVKTTFTGSSLCGGAVTTDQSLYTYVNIGTTPAAPILNSNSPVCVGNSLTLSTPYINGNLYYWTGPNGFSSNNTSISIQTVTSASAGTYSCYVLNSGCQSSVSSMNVTINPVPTASFTTNVVGNTVTFTNTSTNATSYNWTFGDGQTSTQTSPTHTYVSNNNYSVCLTANYSGCNSASNCQLISLGSGNSGSTLSTFAKLFKDTTITHNYWNVYDIVQSPVDSGFICIGQYQNSSNNNFNGVNYFKLDKNGVPIWSRVLPEYSSAYGYKVIKSQNGYLLSMNYNGNVIMEIDEMGNKLWGKKIDYNILDTISNNSHQFGLGSFIRSRNNGYFGFTSYYYTHFFDNWGSPTSTEVRSGIAYTKIDNSGNVLWQKEIRYNLYSKTSLYIRRSYEDQKGNIYLVGNISDAGIFPSYNTYDALIVKLDSMGNHLWSKYYSSSSGIQDEFLSVIVDSNSDIVTSGFSRNNTSNILNGFISKLNQSGNQLVSKSLPVGYSGYLIPDNTISNYDVQIGGYGGGQLQGITNLTNSLILNTQKVFKSYYFNTSLKTFDNKFIMGGQSVISTNPPDLRYSIIKEDYTSSLCIDTILPNVTLSSLTISLNPLTVTSSNISLSVSNFVINPILLNLKDSNLCHQCNRTASIVPSGATAFCSGGNITLTANAGMISYLWSTGQTGQSISVSQTGNYYVAVTDNYSCTAVSQNVSVTVNPLPYADAGIDQAVCSGNNAIIGTSQIANNTYIWSPTTALNNAHIATPTANPFNQTTYTVTVTNNYGCTSSDQMVVYVNPKPNILVSASPSVILSGNNSTLTASGASDYQWSNGMIGSNITVYPIQTTTYVVTGTNSNGCIDTAQITVTVNASGCSNPLPTPQLNINGCSLSITPVANVVYQWYYNNTPIANTNSNQIQAQSGNGSYYVHITSLFDQSCIAQSQPVILSCATGLEDNGLLSKILIYPNPTQSLIHIQVDNSVIQNYDVDILNSIGQLMYVVKSEKQNNLEVNLSDWNSGVYIIRMKTHVGEFNYRIIKD